MPDVRLHSGPPKRRRRKLIVGGIGAAALVVALVVALSAPAGAARPNNQACLGEDFSMYAQAGADWGGFVAGLASTTQGVGTQVQAHLAGEVPDHENPNSCNDD